MAVSVPDGPVRVLNTYSEESADMAGFSTVVANRLLDYAFRGVPPATIPGIETSLHYADPGGAGANELAGLSYDRMPATFSPANAAAIALASNVTFAGLPGAWILYIGAFTTDASPVFIGSMPNGQLKSFSCVASSDVFTSNGHGYTDGMPVALLGVVGTTFPGALTQDTPYYIRNATTNTFQLSATEGVSDPIVNVSSDGVGTVRRIHRVFPGEIFTVLAGSQFSFVGV